MNYGKNKKMKLILTRALIVGMLGLVAAAAVAEEAKPTTSPFRDGETVVFWGDSITQQAKWIRFLTDFYHTRYPDRKITYRNAGIAGNSFGGGIKEIDRDVVPWKPTTVFTMFGMNDSAAAGPYHPGWPSTDAEKAKLRQRVDRGYQVDADRALKDLKAKCGEDLRIVMMTPSIYDSTARTPKDKPVNDGWNTTLGESGKKLIAGYEAGKWELVDLWGPMTKFNAWAQAMNPNFSIVSAQERVHPDDNGGWFMAQQILKAQGVDRTVSEIRFDAAKGKVSSAKRAKVTDVRKTADGWTMTVREEALPFPTAKSAATVAARSKWSDGYGPDSVINYEWFAAEGLAKGVWEFFVDDTLVWRGTDGEFAFGVNLGKNPDTPQMAQAKRVTEKNRLRHEKESRLRALASLRWWLPMGKKVKDPDDVAEVGAWMAANPKNGGLFGGGKMLKEYLVEWPKRQETYGEIEAMDAEIERLRQPVERTWKLVQVEKGERDNPPAKRVTEKRELFNGKDLSGWYKYLSGRGRDNDPLGVFTAKDGVISIHGLGNGCITTKEAFRDYRVQVEYRWVGKSYQGRAWKCHDSGLLFHSRGPDGMYHGTWKWSFEANMIQSRTPDLITVVLRGYRTPKDFTYKATVDVDANDTWTSGGTPKACVNSGHWHNKFTPVPWRDLKANPTVPPEKPMGEWNVLEVVAKGDKAEFFLNGEKTLEAYGLSPTEGQLQIQSEGSDCEVRRVTLLPLD